MGIYQLQTEFRVPEESCTEMLEALKKAMVETPKELLFGGKRRGDEIVSQFAFITHEEILNAADLEEALQHCRWNPEFDEEGNIIDIDFNGQKMGNEDIFFQVIAPFVEASSYIIMVNDQREIWRWRFDGQRCHKESGEITFI
jgi:hypothetical protein